MIIIRILTGHFKKASDIDQRLFILCGRGHKRKVANNIWVQNPPQVLRTSIYKEVKLQTGGRWV